MYAVEMKNVTKKFGNFKANDNINLKVLKGEVHAILGENGAGKSTLMNNLFGIYKIDSGDIFLNEKKVEISSPIKAQELGIGMVHQHFMLVNEFTIIENIILGSEPTSKFGKIDLTKTREALEKLIEKYNFNLNLDEKVKNLSVGEEQKIEILKVLFKDVDIIIFDEPTAVLTPQETTEFLKIVTKLKEEGKTIILITHKLNEIKAVASKCTIIRRGKTIDTINVDDIVEAELANMMVGKKLDLTIRKNAPKFNEDILRVQNINYTDEKNILKLDNISLNLKKGHIHGIAGVDNNGQKELVSALTGLIKPQSGKIEYINNRSKTDLIKKSVRQINQGIISLIPEDRLKEGLIGEYSLSENLILMNYYNDKFSKRGILNDSKILEHGKKMIEKYDVRSSKGIKSKAIELSGGNQQKLIIGRQIELGSDILIAFQPTRGVDVGAIKSIHDQLIEQRDLGKAIILVSMELNEVMSLSDEISVIHDGRIIDTVNANSVTKDEIGLMMAGKKVRNV